MWVVDDNGMLRAVFAIVCSRSRQMVSLLDVIVESFVGEFEKILCSRILMTY